MRKSVTNFYNVDDMKGLVKDVLKKEKVATKDDLVNFATKDELKSVKDELKELVISFKDAILHELQGIREGMELLTNYKDQIENHDVRIEHIEKHLHLTPPT